MALNLPRRTIRLVFLGSCALLAACGRQDSADAEMSAVPIRLVISAMLSRPNFKMPPGRCLCVGFQQPGNVKDFPAGVLDDEHSRYPWLRRWSDCSEFNGQILSPSGCSEVATKFVCGVVDQPSVAKGVRRVECRVYKHSLDGTVQGWDISRAASGKLVAKPSGLDWIE